MIDATAAKGQTLPDGFSNTGEPTVIPSLFFARVLPEITDPAELVVTAYVFYAVTLHRRTPRFVTQRELEADGGLARALANLAGGATVQRGLDLAVERGTLVRATTDGRDHLYVINNAANRKALLRLADQGVEIAETLPAADGAKGVGIFALYEENIGNITPLIADHLKDAEDRYPAEWLSAAFGEAVELNKRSWRYIERILQRWETEGRGHEERTGNPGADWLARRYREGKQRE